MAMVVNLTTHTSAHTVTTHTDHTSCCRLSSLITYYIPKDGPLKAYKEYISMLPNMDHPEAFGQHPNADITSQIQETRLLFETLLSLQPQVATGSGESIEDQVCVTLCIFACVLMPATLPGAFYHISVPLLITIRINIMETLSFSCAAPRAWNQLPLIVCQCMNVN